ncbi:MAG: hypothetical protein ACYTGQ_11105 [Planctomycetota bacterium]
MCVLMLVAGSQVWGGVTGSSIPRSAQVEELKTVPEVAPWGRLVKARVTLQVPRENIGRDAALPDAGNPWRFAMMSREQVEALLLRAGLERFDVLGLMLGAKADPTIRGVTIHPKRSLVAGLSPTSRGEIYHELGKHPCNPDQTCALMFSGASVRTWLRLSDLRFSTVKLVERYAYRRGDYWKVADLALIREELDDEAEYERLVAALSRERSWRVWLVVPEGEDVSGLAAYWGRGGREKQVAKALRKAAARPGGERVQVSRLLPPFPGRVLNTFEMGAFDPSRDCHWFALNFNNASPEGSLENPEAVNREFGDYEAIPFEEAQLGDLISYWNSVYGMYHTAVYIADGLVMTKNGALVSRPYVLMTLDEMMDYYPCPGKVGVVALRRKAGTGGVVSARDQ